MASSDLKFKNTALMLNKSIFIRKELDSLCGHNIGSNNISTCKYSKSKPDIDKKSAHRVGRQGTLLCKEINISYL